MGTKFTVLINTCDKCRFLWKNFSVLFNRYWDPLIKADKYFLSETLTDPTLEGFNWFTPGKIEWSEIVKFALDQISTPYILWLHEDFFLKRTIPFSKFEYYFDFIEKHKVKRFGIHENSRYYTTSIFINDILKFHPQSDYTISLQASIWDTQFLKENIKSKESPWGFETKGSQRINNNSLSDSIYFESQSLKWYDEAHHGGKLTHEYWDLVEKEQLTHTPKSF